MCRNPLKEAQAIAYQGKVDAQAICHPIALSLNIAATLLPELEKFRGASEDTAALKALYADLTKRTNEIAGHLRQG